MLKKIVVLSVLVCVLCTICLSAEAKTYTKYVYDYTIGKKVKVHLTEKQLSEAKVLARLIFKEANTESFRCKLAVGRVVMNRINSKNFPSTVRGVISSRGQFTGTARFALHSNTIVPQKCYYAAYLIVGGKHKNIIPKSVCYFRVPKYSTSKWNRKKYGKMSSNDLTVFYY